MSLAGWEAASLERVIMNFARDMALAFASGDMEIGLSRKQMQRLLGEMAARHRAIFGSVDTSSPVSLYTPCGSIAIRMTERERRLCARKTAWGAM